MKRSRSPQPVEEKTGGLGGGESKLGKRVWRTRRVSGPLSCLWVAVDGPDPSPGCWNVLSWRVISGKEKTL